MEILSELIERFTETKAQVGATNEDVKVCVKWGAKKILSWLQQREKAENARKKFRRCVLAVIVLQRLRKFTKP